ncbi:AAA family ATPase [uncultured Roseivirga sp.]|uniref:ATP-dependent nuclease n=1 Tax=uncultured Roseivirga sp. TaxID=543088 RepID=UPI000D795C0C|nr:AAA family ATPase [uncultured Roseivirga sp.]PWL31832.1 MAG: hypothetical protein DCO95_01190 [Roseivirga sp. XM-24bin3]
MKIKSFEINNYRAIANLTVPLNYSINPIIGVNESGKTSILKAILCLDKDRDRLNKGEHLDYQNKYSTSDTTDCRVIAKLHLSEEDIKNLKTHAKVKTDSNSYKELETLTPETSIEFARVLSNDKKYEVSINTFSPETNKRIANFIQSNFPVFLYFDDFTDRVPEEVVFSETYVNDGKLARGIQREWQEIIEEILKRSELDGIDEENALKNYLKVDDSDRRQDILSDIEDVLNKEIIEEWKKVKQRGKTNFADDSANLELQLNNIDGSNKFIFKVRDTSNKNRKRTFNVSERSKGFQWFFNYMIKLKFNPRYREKKENSIFLLDEPGSYLHSSAQTELLKELKTVSENNVIIYCTHSQFLLNPHDIKLGSIKIADKIDSKVELHLFGEYNGSKNTGALSPVYQALQINGAKDFIGNVIITEGITDYYVLKMLQENWNLPERGTTIIPGSGAGNSSTLISFALGFAKKFILVFDNDKGGLNAAKKYKKEFGDRIEGYFHFYHKNESSYCLEDHFSKVDQNRLLEFTGTSDVKKAIPILYLDFHKSVFDFLDGLEEVSKKALGITINSIGF